MQPSDTAYKVAVRGASGNPIFIEDVLQEFSWEEVSGELAMRATLRAPNIRVGDKRLAQIMANGSDIIIRAGDPDAPDRIESRFVGRTFGNQTAIGADGHSHGVTAYDPLFYLMQSEDDRYFPAGRDGRTIIRDLAKTWEIPVGEMKGPTEKLGKKMFRGITIAEMIDRTLRDTARQDGGRWVVRMEDGKLTTVRRAMNKKPWHFAADNIVMSEVARSIENLVTVVKIVGREKGGSKSLATATSELAKDYGNLQRIVNRADYNTAKAAKRAATKMLKGEDGQEQKFRTVVAADVPSCRKFDRVHVESGTMQGFYVVESVFHDPSSKTMTLELDTETEEEIAIRFKETGLWDWIPPEAPSGGGGAPFTGAPHEALAIASGVTRGPAWVYEKALPAAQRAGGGFTITSWQRSTDSVDGPGVSWHYNGGRALDIVASPLSRLNRLYTEMQKEHPVELLWQVEDHYDHLHTAWSEP